MTVFTTYIYIGTRFNLTYISRPPLHALLSLDQSLIPASRDSFQTSHSSNISYLHADQIQCHPCLQQPQFNTRFVRRSLYHLPVTER